MDLFLEGLKNGLAMGSIYALIALGYSMVYGIVKMINFAHSEFITIGGFVAYYLAEKVLVPVLGKLPIPPITAATNGYNPIISDPKLNLKNGDLNK